MAEDWDFYLCTVNDAVASIALDLNARPDDERPWLLCVRVEMKQPTEHGLSHRDEADDLADFEDALTAAMGIHGAFQVARMTRAGFREFFFYGKEDEPLAEILDDVVPESGYQVAWRTEEDPEWGFFAQLLYPDPKSLRYIWDRRVCRQLAEHGDDPQAERPVDHFVRFESEESAEAFAKAAQAQGFSASIEDNNVSLQRADRTELEHIHEVAWAVIELADEHDGDYDGWGAPIVSAE